MKVMVTLLGRPSWVCRSGVEHHSGYVHGVLVHKGGRCGPHCFTQKDPLLTCPGTRKSRCRMQACRMCPSEGLVPASVHGAERDCSGGQEILGDRHISPSTSGDTCQIAKTLSEAGANTILGCFPPSPGNPSFVLFLYLLISFT